MIRINLLPWRSRLRMEKKREFLLSLGVMLALTGAVLLSIHAIIATQITRQMKREHYLEQQIALLNGQLTDLKDMQKQKELLLSRMKIIQQLQSDRLLVVHLFDELAKLIPEGLYLTSVKREGAVISFEGKAQTNTQVSTFMRNLENSQWYTLPILKEIKDDDSEDSFSSRFVLQVQQKVSVGGEKANAEGH